MQTRRPNGADPPGELPGHLRDWPKSERFVGGFGQLQRWARSHDLSSSQRARHDEVYLETWRNRLADPDWRHLDMPPDSAREIHDVGEIINHLWGSFTLFGVFTGPGPTIASRTGRARAKAQEVSRTGSLPLRVRNARPESWRYQDRSMTGGPSSSLPAVLAPGCKHSRNFFQDRTLLRAVQRIELEPCVRDGDPLGSFKFLSGPARPSNSSVTPVGRQTPRTSPVARLQILG